MNFPKTEKEIKPRASLSFQPAGWADSPYTHGEDERMVTAVIAVINRNLLSPDELSQWLDGLVESAKAEPSDPARFRHENIQSLLRSLYLRLNHLAQSSDLQTHILKGLKEINQFVES